VLEISPCSGPPDGELSDPGGLERHDALLEDRRKHARHKVVGLACTIYSFGLELHALIRDMSTTGANVIVPTSRRPGTGIVVIGMRLPSVGTTVMEATIRACVPVPTGYSLCLSWEFPDDTYKKRVADFLATLPSLDESPDS